MFLTNYIYYPWVKSLKKFNYLKTMIITFLVFVIAGVWHGPSWGYILFGSMHGLGLVINHTYKNFIKINLNKYVSWFITFNFINVSFVFFRSKDIETTINILKSMVGINGYDYTFLLNQNIANILIFAGSFAICLLFKNTNFLIENFKPINLKKDFN